MVMPQNPQGYGQPGQPPPGQPFVPPGQPGPSGVGPGRPAPPFPEEIKLIGVFQLIAGILGGLQFLALVVGTFGCILLALTPIFAAVVAGLEIYNGAKTLGGNPNPSSFWWKTLPIPGIVAVIGGDYWSMAAGIAALVLVGRDHVKGWIR